MDSPTRARFTTDGVQFQSTCFACGADNRRGLQLQFRADSDGATTASWVPGPEWEGSHGVIHGGIVTTLLDEAMAKAVAATGSKAMTADLRIRFRRYAATGERLRVRGWVVKHKARLIEAEALLVAADGSERAHAWGKFLVVVKPQT
ncbi:MAG: PaaI family thioesterase [Terriglobia bacterium]